MSIQDGIKSSLFICLTAGLHINYSTDFHKKKIGGKVAHTPWKKILDFGGNLVRVSVTVGWEQRHTQHVRMYYVAFV